MFAFVSPNTVSLRVMRNIFALIIVYFLSAALCTGCQADDEYIDDGKLKAGLIGQWKSEYSGGEELYTITANPDTLIYADTFMGTWGGKIVHVSNFSEDAGVLIIEYDADKKQNWVDWNNNMADITPSGNFYGIYFSKLRKTSVILANTSEAGGPSETDTLEQAKAKFTSGKKGNYTYPVGTAQIKQ